jgi:colanic acid/amylovoran biosynthesis glycosyltransferase
VTRVIYVTVQLPYGATEPFVIAEIAHLERGGCEVTVVPLRPKGRVVHGDAAALLPKAAVMPLLSGTILRAAFVQIARAPAGVIQALFSLGATRSPRILLKNLAVFPKALWLADYARRLGADHIHAHWAGTSATLAMLAAQVSDIPWSFTAHRWDISENNLLGLKARRACFVRAISAHGADELRELVGRPAWSPWLLHMGVSLPAPRAAGDGDEPPLRVLTAARFVEKKGHVYLIDAVRRLKDRGVSIRVELAGDGPLARSLHKRVRELGLEEEVVFLGPLSHDELLEKLCDHKWQVAALPSIITSSGQLEGIPVSLIEAMACGLPTISTETGGIPELLDDGAGILVPPADSEALAEALATLVEDGALRAALAVRGRERVEEEFSADRVAAALHARFRECAGVG